MVCVSSAESQDTSSSAAEDTVSVSFEDVSYTVRRGILDRSKKLILDSVSGSFSAGELSVVLGQSGAGKSSLMDIVAGYTKPTSGRLLVNGRIRDERWFRRRSCYIMQNDQLQDWLTVAESLAIAADLKLGKHVNSKLKKQRIEEVVTALGLRRSQGTRVANLSGGQRKRLAIGLEIISDPPIMILDEPISGLDSSMSKQIVYILQMLAGQGRTVVITLHQPSAILLQMVDRLYAVVGGRCAYMGSVPKLLPYLERLDLRCPKFHNPVDFFIEICTENAERLVSASLNGNCTEWLANDPVKLRDESVVRQLSMLEEISLTALPSPKEDETSKILLRLKSTYPTTTWTQFCALTKRSLMILWRDPGRTKMVTGIHCMTALFIGCLFFNIGKDAKYSNDNYNFLYFSLMFLMFTAFSSVSISFPQELPVIRREHFNRWYNVWAYYSATFISSLPTQTACTLVYACITYWMTGQPPNLIRFLGFCWMLLQVSCVALCIGLLNGSLFNIKHAVVFGPFFIMPFTIFSGFFLSYQDAPDFFKWLFHVSFLKHGLTGLMLSIFGMGRGKMPCSEVYCHYTYPQQFLQDKGFLGETYYYAVIILILIGTLSIISTFVILKIRLRCRW